MANKLFWVALISFFFCYVYMTNAASSSASESGSGSFSMSSSGSFSMTGSDSISSSVSAPAASKSKSRAAPSKSKSRAAASKSKSRAAASKSKTRAAASKSKTKPAAKGTASQTFVVLPQVINLDNTCKTQPRVVCLSWTDPILARGFVFTDHQINWRNSSNNAALSANSGLFTNYRVEDLLPGKTVEFTVFGIETSTGRSGIPVSKNFTTANLNTTNPLQNDDLSIKDLVCTQTKGDQEFTYDVTCKWTPAQTVPFQIKAKLNCKAGPDSSAAKKPNKKENSNPGEAEWNIVIKRRGGVTKVDLKCSAKIKALYKNQFGKIKAANALTAQISITQ